MSFCVNCGKELLLDQNYCPSCGRKVINQTEETVTAEPQTITVPKCYTVFGNVGHGLALATLILSFIPIFNFYAWIVGVHGIVFSALGKKDVKQLEKCRKALRRSIIFSIVGLVLFFVYLVVLIFVFPE